MAFWTITPLTYQLISTLITILFFTYLWFQYKFSYWSNKGVGGPKPTFPFGNIKDMVFRREQFFQLHCDNYFKYKHLPYVGTYSFHLPVLSIHDPDIAKLILIKDFDHFQTHGAISGGNGSPLSGSLFNIHGKRWKDLRLKMSPTFTSGKLKTMYPLVNEIASQALEYVDEKSSEVINFSELYSRYTMEIISSVGFGVQCNGLKDAESEFYLFGNQCFELTSFYWSVLRAISFFMPDLFIKLRIRHFSSRIVNFFYNLVKERVDYREKHSQKRNDFLQTLIELKNGQIVNENGEITHVHSFPFTLHDVAANSMLYMLAGYETSSTTGQFAAYQLALNPDIQAKARQEVHTVLAKYGGEFTYEAQNEMVYLNMVLEETMRMHPPMRALFRRCTKDYKMPDTDLTIEKGTLILVPIQSIHMDPDIFPEPEKFDPERFNPENRAKMHPCHWMPFGEGPRKCLGMRQGYIQSKTALVKILQKYELLPVEKTSMPVKIKTSSLVYAADGGVWLKLRKLE